MTEPTAVLKLLLAFPGARVVETTREVKEAVERAVKRKGRK